MNYAKLRMKAKFKIRINQMCTQTHTQITNYK